MVNEKTIPMHMGFSLAEYSEKDNLSNMSGRLYSALDIIFNFQAEINIPIVSVFVLPKIDRSDAKYDAIIENLVALFSRLSRENIFTGTKTKVNFLGKWYDLPSTLRDEIKRLTDDTKDYDGFFLNICVNYDGQEEIVDACKMIARKIGSGKIEVDSIDRESIKENIYSSSFLPVDLMVIGKECRPRGFMLWDSVNSMIYQLGKDAIEIKKADLIEAIDSFSR